jgi:hypothetical protein
MFCQAANAQTTTARFHFEDCWLRPDVSHRSGQPRQVTGEFEWTYTVGDLENAAGQFHWFDVSWFCSDMNKMIVTIDLGSIEFGLNSNFHGLDLEVSLHLVEWKLRARSAAGDFRQRTVHAARVRHFWNHEQSIRGLALSLRHRLVNHSARLPLRGNYARPELDGQNRRDAHC